MYASFGGNRTIGLLLVAGDALSDVERHASQAVELARTNRLGWRSTSSPPSSA
jgi:hypothetical protein